MQHGSLKLQKNASTVQLKSSSLMPFLGKSLSSTKSREKDISRTIVSEIVPVFPCMLASDRSNNFEVICWEFVTPFLVQVHWSESVGAQPHVIAYYRVFLFSEAIINTSEGSTQAKTAKRESVFSGSRQTTSYLRPIHWCGPSCRRLLSIYSLDIYIPHFQRGQMDPSRQYWIFAGGHWAGTTLMWIRSKIILPDKARLLEGLNPWA